MANMIQMAKDQITELVNKAYLKAAEKGELPTQLELKGGVGPPPPKAAQTLIDNMELAGSWFESVEIAGPGFMNFRMGDKWYGDVLKNIAAEGADYGRCDIGGGKKRRGAITAPAPRARAKR